MRRLYPILSGLAAICFAGLLLHGCRETPEPTSPNFGRTKLDRSLTIKASGNGTGRVIVGPVGEIAGWTCDINDGQWDEAGCTKTYPWKSVAQLTIEVGQGSTFTGWSGACTGTSPTCKVTLTQSRIVTAGLTGSGVQTYTLNVVGAGTGSGKVTSQQGLSPAINCTITAGTGSGACTGSYPNGTSVVLTPAATSGSFDAWSGDCSGSGTCTPQMTANRAVTATFTAPPGPEASVGKWDAPISMPVIGLHLSELTNGKLLLWGHGGEPQTFTLGGGFSQVSDNTCTDPTTCELFCTGHTYLADGRLLVAGGHNEALGDNYGLKQASIFNGTSWSVTGSMTYARWYPTLVTLENGDVVAISGNQAPSTLATIPERYNGTSWTSLTGASLGVTLYPRAFVEPKNGWIYYAGENAPRYLNPNGTGAWTSAPPRVVTSRGYGSAVMLDSKVLYAGGGGSDCSSTSSPVPENRVEMVDLAAATPTWSAVAPMNFRRRQLNATILPDGTVMASGGTSSCGFTTETGAVFAAEDYNPSTNSWTVWANASVVRVYHSTAVLLPDGRVLVTGSGDGGGTTQQHTYQIFSPPYLFKGTRPSYNLTSNSMKYGQPFTVQTANTPSITKVTLIRLNSTTHAFDMGQRLNTLSFQKAADGLSLTVTPPASGRIAPPGPYMLFILNDKGIPSVAQTVLLSQ
jgi:hypothetical protein